MSKEPRFKVNYIHILTQHEHKLETNKDCSICRQNLNTNSLYNQEKGIDSYVVQGTCSHSFHNECIKPWIAVNNHCPLCSKKWVYKDKPTE